MTTSSCYRCGLTTEKPYAIWHWQSGKPARSYCFLCWEQNMHELKHTGTYEICGKPFKFNMKSIAIATARRIAPGLFPKLVRTYQRMNGLLRYGDVRFPASFSIEISKFCNRTCSYCPNSIHETPRENISDELYGLIVLRLQEIKWNGVVDFIFYNEPLLHPNIVGLVERLKTHVPWCMPRIITNGDPLTEELARRLISAGVVTFWVSRHVPVKPGWDDRMASLRGAFPGFITVIDLMDVQSKQGLHTRAGLVKVEKEYQVDACFSSESCQHIDINGNLILCCNDYHRAHAFGNLKDSTIMEIWNKAEYATLRRELRHGITNLTICQNCIVKQRPV